MSDDGEPVAVNAADVQPEKVRWLMPRYIPLGKVTVLDGDPEKGKSAFTIDLAARVSTHSPMPDGSRTEADSRGVVIINGEDGLADTMVPRLIAAGADRKEIEFLDAVWRANDDGKGLHEGAVTLLGGLPAIKTLIERTHAALVIIDPLPAFLDEGINSYRDSDVRRALFPLTRLAEHTGAAVILVRHLNKQTGGNPLYRGGGSIGIIGAARAGLLIALDPNDEDRRILAVTKSNLAKKPPALAFRVVPAEPHDCVRIVWEGPTKYRPEDLLGAVAKVDPDEASKVADAADWLTTFLGEWDQRVEVLRQQADRAGFRGWRTMETAKARLKVRSLPRRDSKGKIVGWRWHLPGGKSPGDDQSADTPEEETAGQEQTALAFGSGPTAENGKSPGQPPASQTATGLVETPDAKAQVTATPERGESTKAQVKPHRKGPAAKAQVTASPQNDQT